jgi:hypothetical protein
MKPRSIQNSVGKPVKGSDFFDREKETVALWERLKTDDVLLLAPRRVGKTSLMFHLADTAADHEFDAKYITVSDVNTEFGFVQKLCAAIDSLSAARKVQQQLKKSPIARFLRKITKINVMGSGFELSADANDHWAEVGEAIASALHAAGGKTLLLIDELPIFVLTLLKRESTRERAHAFLNWFRALRQDPESSANVRWLLAGSIGLDTVTRRMNLGDTINDLYLENGFGAFSDGTALAFLDALAGSYGMTLTSEVKAHICHRAGWLIPFHLQLVFSELRTACDGAGTTPTVAVVDDVFEHLLSPANKSYFDYWEQRLREELGPPEDKQAIALLDAVVKDDDGVSADTLRGVMSQHLWDPAERDERTRYLIDVLTSDGYIVQADGRYQFRSVLLRDFWRRRAL